MLPHETMSQGMLDNRYFQKINIAQRELGGQTVGVAECSSGQGKLHCDSRRWILVI